MQRSTANAQLRIAALKIKRAIAISWQNKNQNK